MNLAQSCRGRQKPRSTGPHGASIFRYTSGFASGRVCGFGLKVAGAVECCTWTKANAPLGPRTGTESALSFSGRVLLLLSSLMG